MRLPNTIHTALALCLWAAGCSGDNLNQAVPVPPATTDPDAPAMAFSHDEQLPDLFADGTQLPLAKAVVTHACAKIRYSSLGNILASRGVNIANTAQDSAGQLYQAGNLVLGAADPVANLVEGGKDTTGGITKLFDVLVAAADEMIANMPMRPECTVNNVGAQLFNADASCNADGFTCLLGMPVTVEQLGLCNDMVHDFGTDTATGHRLAVAAFAAPTFLCND